MFNYRPSRRTQYVGGGILLVLLLIYIVFRCLPPSQEEVDKSAVTIRQEAYYTLEADGKPLAYFADYVDSAFVGGSINKDSIHTRCMTQRGYWVNRLPVVPSCHGRILIRWNYKPLTIVNLKGNRVLQLVRQTMTQMDSELDGLQTKRNEMGYYLRVHSVQDYGYNKIAEYHTEVVQQMDSLRRMIKVLDSLSTSSAQLRIRQQNRYAIQTSSKKAKPTVCNRLEIDKKNDCVLLQTESKRTPIRLITRLQKSGAIDALNAYYKTHAATISSLVRAFVLLADDMRVRVRRTFRMVMESSMATMAVSMTDIGRTENATALASMLHHTSIYKWANGRRMCLKVNALRILPTVSTASTSHVINTRRIIRCITSIGTNCALPTSVR